MKFLEIADSESIFKVYWSIFKVDTNISEKNGAKIKNSIKNFEKSKLEIMEWIIKQEKKWVEKQNI